MSQTDISNEIGELKDTVDNLRGALEIPMPPQFHVTQMKNQLEEISEKLKSIYIEMTDENHWRNRANLR